MSGNSSNLQIDIQPSQKDQHYQVVVFRGDLDKAGLSCVKQDLEALTGRFVGQYLVYDLTQLHFINSESIGFLMTMHSRLAKANKSLVLIGACDNVKDVFQVIGLFHIMRYYENLASFLETLGS